jgi:hypothetical protein
LLALLVAGGCATMNTYPPPTSAQLASAERSVKAARDAGAGQETRSAKYLRDAERELADAKQAAANGDNTASVLGLARAEVDAEYGHALYLQQRTTRQAELTEQQLAETRGSPPAGRTPTPAPAGPVPLAPSPPSPTTTPLPPAAPTN